MSAISEGDIRFRFPNIKWRAQSNGTRYSAPRPRRRLRVLRSARNAARLRLGFVLVGVAARNHHRVLARQAVIALPRFTVKPEAASAASPAMTQRPKIFDSRFPSCCRHTRNVTARERRDASSGRARAVPVPCPAAWWGRRSFFVVCPLCAHSWAGQTTNNDGLPHGFQGRTAATLPARSVIRRTSLPDLL